MIVVQLVVFAIDYNDFSRVYFSRTFNTLWRTTQEELVKVLHKDRELQKSTYDERIDVVVKLRWIYVQYLSIARKLDVCLSNMIQPQKVLLIRKTLDLTLARCVEVKHELIAIDFTDIQHCDEAMQELKKTPGDLKVIIPSYIRKSRQDELQKRSLEMDEILKRAGLDLLPMDDQSELTIHDAVRIIQKHERAKQGRAKATLRRDLIARQKREKIKTRQLLEKEDAIIRIQAFARGMASRKHVKKMREQEEIFLGLRRDPTLSKDYQKTLSKIYSERFRQQSAKEREMKNNREALQRKIIYKEGPSLMSDTEASIREWMFQEKYECGKFPDLPDEDDGGSAAILGRAGHFIQASGQSDTHMKKSPEKSKDQSKQKKKEEDESHIMARQSLIMADLKKTAEEFKTIWAWRKLEEDSKEDILESLLEGDVRVTVEEEIRKQVDNMMRHELQRLKEDVEGEKKGAKKKKKKAKGRKRKEKDLTPDRSPESLFEELVLNGIIKKIPDKSLENICGHVNFAGSASLTTSRYPLPSMNDLKNILVEYIALPLGIETVRNTTPLVKSVLLCGPKECEKMELIYCICHDIGATLFDLTPSNIVGRYPGRAGLLMLIHLVIKVGRLYPPCIILVDEADKMFMKKVPKTDKTDPKRLRKELPKLVKNITIDDKIVVIGLSTTPWNCDMKSLSTVYQKHLLIYRPTFSARADLWRHYIEKAGGKVTANLDLASLARICDGYLSGHIEYIVPQVLTEQRIQQKDILPFTAHDFIQPLSKLEPIFKEEEEAYKLWYMKTPLMKRRAKLLEEELEMELAKAKAAKGAESKIAQPTITKRKKKKKKSKKKT